MTLPCYLAMTAGEFASAKKLPEHPAWMACHFSCYSTGLSNLPHSLPPGAMVIVNDRTPPYGHDCKVVLEQLRSLVEDVKASAVLLDFQRPDYKELFQISKAVSEGLPCPVAVTEAYARQLHCPVFLSPPPLHIPLQEHLIPWKDREVWLEAMPDAEVITVTETDHHFIPLQEVTLEAPIHESEELFCRYHIEVLEDRAVFTLERTNRHLPSFLAHAKDLGVIKAIGLYQQLKLPEG